ncbi:MAG: PDGLE domain-containing protein [Dehalococcoidia bacterium]
MTQPTPVPDKPQTLWRRYGWVAVGLVAACAIVFVLAPAASSDPDGLDRVSDDHGFAESAEESRYEWLPDYSVPGVGNEYTSLILAGLIGVGVVFALTLVAGWAARQAGSRRAS